MVNRYMMSVNYRLEEAYIFDLKMGEYVDTASTLVDIVSRRCEYLNAKEELVQNLKKVSKQFEEDPEEGHYIADCLLLDYIDDEDIKQAYENVSKWYA